MYRKKKFFSLRSWFVRALPLYQKYFYNHKMATSLASQLYKMQHLDRGASNERAHNIRASFLFDGKQAADMDSQTILDIGQDGLQELRQMNRGFDQYADTLFSDAVKDMDRMLQNKEENAKLDSTIRSFLFQMAPYFLTKPAGKALEWLIRRFRIHEFNVRDILAAIMPYHETKAFLNMLTIVTFDTKDMDMFGFLVTQRKARRLLDRNTLMAQCVRDRRFMSFICKAVFKACKKRLDYPGLHSFYAMLMSQYIGQLPTINDNDIQFVLPFVLDGLNQTGNGDGQIAAYMVLGSLANRVVLTGDALDQILLAIVKKPSNIRAMAMCLVQLLQTQQQGPEPLALPARFLHRLSAHGRGFSLMLNELEDSFDLELFMKSLLSSLVRFGLTDSEIGQFLSELVSSLSASYAPILCNRLIDEYVGQKITSEGVMEHSGVIGAVRLRFSQPFEDAIGAAATNGHRQWEDRMSKEQLEAAHKVLYELKLDSGSVSGVLPLQETATTLYLSLNHSDQGIRLVGAKALFDIVSGNRTDFELPTGDSSSLIVERLQQEDSSEVLDVVLSLPLADLVTATELVLALVSIIEDGRVPLHNLQDKVIGNLLSIDVSRDDDLYGQVATAIFPYLFKSSELSLTQTIYTKLSKSNFCKLANDGWLSSLKSMGTKGKKDLDAGKFNAQVAQQLASKLTTHQTPSAVQLWRPLLDSPNMLSKVTAIVVGTYYVHLLSTSKDQVNCVSAAEPVLVAIMSILSSNTALPSKKKLIAGAAQLESVDSADWHSLLEHVADVKLVMGAMSIVLQTLSSSIKLSPNQWFAIDLKGEKESQYRDIVRKTFSMIVSRPSELNDADGVLIGRLLSLTTGDEWAQFLASMWLGSSNNSELDAIGRSRCLITFQALLTSQHNKSLSASEKIDYQTVLPSVLVALGDEDAHVRGAAAACIKALRAAYPETIEEPKKRSKRKSSAASDAQQNIYKYDEFYGGDKDGSNSLQYLPTAIITKFMVMLSARMESMTLDVWAARNMLATILNHGSIGEQLPKLNSQARGSVIAFLLSHVLEADSVCRQLQIRLLEMMGQVASPLSAEQLFPLLTVHVGKIDKNEDDNSLVRALVVACFNASTAGYLIDNSKCWQMFASFVDGSHGDFLQKVAFESLIADTEFVSAIGDAALTELTSKLIGVAMRGQSNNGHSLREVFVKMVLDGTTAASALSDIATTLSVDDSDQGRSGKRARGVVDAAAAQSEARAVALSELSLLLEYIQVSSCLGTNVVLIPSLFSVLGALVADVSGASGEYAEQMVLTLLTRIVDAATSSDVQVSESSIRVDTIVQAVRASGSPQTHNQALLLLASVATQHPDAVLHHVMPVFTFMGANVLRQDDAYSFHVIEQTLERILPPLVRAAPEQLGRTAQISQAGPVLRVFVDALSHIPRHRRLALFATLVRTMGTEVYGPAVLSLLLEKSTNRVLTSGSGAARDDDIVSFALSLTHELAPEEQIICIEAVVSDLMSLPAAVGSDGKAVAIQKVASADTPLLYLDLTHMEDKHLRTYRLIALDFAHRLLTSRQFISKFTKVTNDDEEVRRNGQLLAKVTETMLGVISTLSAQFSELTQADLVLSKVAERAWKQAQQLAYSILDDANGLMDRRTFADTAIGLLRHKDLKIRRRALALANTRLSESNSEDKDILEMLSPIADAASSTEDLGEAQVMTTCRQAALLCIATASRRFAVHHPALFTGIVKTVASSMCLDSEEPLVTASALVALSVLCGELGTRMVPSLPQYLPLVLKHLRACVNGFETASEGELSVLVAALATMQAVVENTPAFLAPSLPPLFTCLLNPVLHQAVNSSDNDDDDEEDDKLRKQARHLADEVLVALAKNIPPRLLLPAQFTFFQKEAIHQGIAVIVPLVAFVGRAASALQKAHLLQFYKHLFKFFLSVFDLARSPQMPAEDVVVVEQTTLDAFLRLIVKLNENLFKPLFLSFVEWATADPSMLSEPVVVASSNNDGNQQPSNAEEARLRVFYRTLNCLFDRLKSILTPYYAHVIDTTADQLSMLGVARDSIELQEEADRSVKPVPGALWRAVVDSVYQSALHDTAGFWNDDRIRKVCRPLAYQLGNTKETEDLLYVDRVRDHLAPAISQLAVAAGNDALWKQINQEVLLKTRSESASVRVGSLVVLQACYERLGEEYLILLPESIPYLAELLDDDDVRVERATQETIKVIESHLGESLQSYLH